VTYLFGHTARGAGKFTAHATAALSTDAIFVYRRHTDTLCNWQQHAGILFIMVAVCVSMTASPTLARYIHRAIRVTQLAKDDGRVRVLRDAYRRCRSSPKATSVPVLLEIARFRRWPPPTELRFSTKIEKPTRRAFAPFPAIFCESKRESCESQQRPPLPL
jgi:hypothetical protein